MSSEEAPAMPSSSRSNRMLTQLSPQWQLQLLETGEQYDCSITSVNCGSDLLARKVHKILMPVFIEFHHLLSPAGVEMPQVNFERGFRCMEGDAV